TGQSIELNAFIIPVDGLQINGDWKLEVTLSSGAVVTKILKSSATGSNPNPNTTLIAGKIHRLGNMPFLPVEPFDPARWMELIPRNVYLSEISIPGSWNTLEPSAQEQASGSTPTEKGIATINAQYAKGCRGFHFDCRYKWTTASHTETETYYEHEYHKHDRDRDHHASGQSIFDDSHRNCCQACWDYLGVDVEHSRADIRYDRLDPIDILVEKTREITVDDSGPTLGVVQGVETKVYYSDDYPNGAWFIKEENITFEDALKTIIANLSPTEYMVLSCSWAHNSTDPDTKQLDPPHASTWLRSISEVCAAHPEVYDASTITPQTTVGEVLGKIIVIVNLEDAISNYTMPSSSKCLFVTMPQVRTQAMYALGYMSNENMYKADGSTSGVKMANTLAQICTHNDAPLSTDRGWAPTYKQTNSQRQTAGQTILDWSAAQFASSTYAHDTWQYQGLGGYTVAQSSAAGEGPGYTGVASVLNAWIDGRIGKMKVSPAEGSDETIFHPIGLIFMNQVTVDETEGYQINGPQTCKNILELNNKFQKKY
ncbi:MAG: hypothetical protein HUJ99_09195, partial [Bacteroidaceae bacterium]|nr:hypothetical protein [Bacteroidaceae bacterium]